jgi:hypothetical protein
MASKTLFTSNFVTSFPLDKPSFYSARKASKWAKTAFSSPPARSGSPPANFPDKTPNLLESSPPVRLLFAYANFPDSKTTFSTFLHFQATIHSKSFAFQI